MKIKQLTSYLETLAPLVLQEEYDNSGLQVGNETDAIKGVLLCLDCNEEVVEEAISKNCNLIITHHPIIFKGLKKIAGRSYTERIVEKAIRNSISIYAIHTNLDNVAIGVNKKICHQIGLLNCKILLPKPSTENKIAVSSKTGSGMIGNLTTPITELMFLKHLKIAMKTSSIRYTSLLGKKIKKVAICGGSGSFLLSEAMRQKADVFITSDFKYHQFFDADGKIVIMDIGHYESEQFTPQLIYDLLKRKFSIFALHLSKINTNPINYI